MSSATDRKQYGPISVRVYRKTIPTLETGRRSKHLVLVGEEAMKREKRRESNRVAAKKLKEKRHIIEDVLIDKIKELENQESHLQQFVEQLHQQKLHRHAELNQLNHQILNEIGEVLSDDIYNNPSQYEQYSLDMELFDETFEKVLNDHLKTCFSVVETN